MFDTEGEENALIRASGFTDSGSDNNWRNSNFYSPILEVSIFFFQLCQLNCRN